MLAVQGYTPNIGVTDMHSLTCIQTLIIRLVQDKHKNIKILSYHRCAWHWQQNAWQQRIAWWRTWRQWRPLVPPPPSVPTRLAPWPRTGWLWLTCGLTTIYWKLTPMKTKQVCSFFAILWISTLFYHVIKVVDISKMGHYYYHSSFRRACPFYVNDFHWELWPSWVL